MASRADNLAETLAAWRLAAPWTVHSLTAGSNNLTYSVENPSGAYLLRLYQNTADPLRIRYEHALLSGLQHEDLSFEVPIPIPARSGETLISGPESCGAAYAALFPVIPGRQPSGADLTQYKVCGAALAELDEALARIDLAPTPGSMTSLTDLYHWHPSVPDPMEMVEGLPVAQEKRSRVLRIFQELLAMAPALRETLPHQTVHRDFDASNVLMEGDRVTGIVDFEFAHPDLRAVDLAVALCQLADGMSETAIGWERMMAFGFAYCDHLPLTPVEIEALPALMLFYRAVSLIHRAGRFRQGQAGEGAVLARVEALLQVEDWLKVRQDKLMGALSCSPGSGGMQTL